jgi:hypothetical protein
MTHLCCTNGSHDASLCGHSIESISLFTLRRRNIESEELTHKLIDIDGENRNVGSSEQLGFLLGGISVTRYVEVQTPFKRTPPFGTRLTSGGWRRGDCSVDEGESVSTVLVLVAVVDIGAAASCWIAVSIGDLQNRLEHILDLLQQYGSSASQ